MAELVQNSPKITRKGRRGDNSGLMRSERKTTNARDPVPSWGHTRIPHSGTRKLVSKIDNSPSQKGTAKKAVEGKQKKSA